jgi:hypothetical protein
MGGISDGRETNRASGTMKGLRAKADICAVIYSIQIMLEFGCLQ